MYYNGLDYSTFKPDGTSGLTFDIIADPRDIVAQHVMRRWILEPGQLDIATIGVGIRRYLNSSLTAGQIDELTAALESSAQEVDGLDQIVIRNTKTTVSSGLGLSLNIVATISLSQVFGGATFDTVFTLTATTAAYIVAGQIT